MKIYYGISNYSIDVTSICFDKLLCNNIISIPSGDYLRAKYFTDPLINVHKKIFILNNDTYNTYDENVQININLLSIDKFTIEIVTESDIDDRTRAIQSKLKLKYGSFHEELPEQKMSVRYLTGNEKVLEIGGNIGRNSLIIATILKKFNNTNFVTLESDFTIANQLTENRDLNDFNFFIECSALSNRKLIQKGWETIPSDTLIEGYNHVKIITFDNLKHKYNIEFNTLVLDCEGAFYYILLDMPEILNNINLIIMENDYNDLTHKQYIDNVLLKNNFYLTYAEAGGWGPCYLTFFEVWKKS